MHWFSFIHPSIHSLTLRTWSLAFGDGVDEAKHSGAAEEFGDEERGVALGLGRLDPLQARTQHASFAATLAQHSASVATHDDGQSILIDVLKGPLQMLASSMINSMPLITYAEIIK